MQKVLITGKQLLLSTAVALLVFSCSKDTETPINQDAELSKTEVKTVMDTDELSSIADDVVRDLFENGQSAKTSKIVDCYEALYTNTGFSVTFTDCSVKEGSDNLTGSISVVYEMGAETTGFAVTFADLMVGNININGTRTFSFPSEQTNSIEFTVTSNMVIVMGDGAVIKENGNKTVGIDLENGLENGLVTLDGEWVVEADGNTYSVNITSLLETKFGCEYVGKGIMFLAKNGLEVSVDFGDGGCDDMAELTYPDGTKEEFSLKD